VDAQAAEFEAVRKALEVLIADADTSTDRMRVHAAYLGPDALSLLSGFVTTGTPAQRLKAVKVLETLAYNRVRSPESVTALSGLSKDPDPKTRESAIEALFWSAVDPGKFPSYWAPGETDLNRLTDTKTLYALPFDDCREQLDTPGLPMARDERGVVKGGRRPVECEPVPQACDALQAFYWSETDPDLKLSALIQSVRAGKKGLMRKLISYLEPEPSKELDLRDPKTKQPIVVIPASAVNRAWRCLRDETGRTQRRFDDWVSWWAR